MRERLASLAIALLTHGACAGGPPAPVALAHGLPEPADLTYVSGDTVTVSVEAGGQSFDIAQRSSATFETGFARSGDDVQVSLTVRSLSGTMTQPMGSPVTADEGGVVGPLVFTMDRQGDVEVVSQPTVSDDAATFFGPLSLAHTFFPALPGRPVAVGDAWVDTVQYSGPQGRGDVSSTSVVTYTVTRDTVVAGRSVLRLDIAGTAEQTASGLLQGLDFSQTLSGGVEGYVLWDMTRRLMVESYGEAELRGNMRISGAPFPLNLHVRGLSRARLGS